MHLFMITDNQGNTLADNLREPYALSMAMSMAKELQQTVTLYDRSAAASDNGIEVHPHHSCALGCNAPNHTRDEQKLESWAY